MSNSMSTVFYCNEEIKTTVIDKETWWALVDVCRVIGIKNNRDVAKKLDEDEKADVDLIYPSSNGVVQKRKYLMINEFGLYHVLLTARSEKAKRFTHWVTHDVLPRIRKYGYYKLTPDEKREEKERDMIKKIDGWLSILGEGEQLDSYIRRYGTNNKEANHMLEERVCEKIVAEKRAQALEKYPHTDEDIEHFGIDIGLAMTNMKSAGIDTTKYMTEVKTKDWWTETLYNDAFVKQSKKHGAVLDKERYRKYYLNS